RARGLLDGGKYAEAVRCLESAVHRQPDFPDLHHMLGLALSLVGESLRAETHLARALELNLNYAEAHLNLSILLFERNAYASARDHLREFSRIVHGATPSGMRGLSEPALDDLARRHADLGDTYRRLGLLEEAETQLRTALQLRPSYRDVRLQLVRVLFERRNLDEAAQHVAVLLQQSPEYQDARLLHGHIERARGNVEGARLAWTNVRRGAAATQARALLEQLDEEERARRGR